MALSDARRSTIGSAADRHPAATFFALTLGISWSLWIPPLMLVPGLATILVLIPGAFGPMLAAAVVTRVRGESVRRWLSDALTVRPGGRWYAVAFGLPVLVSLAMAVAFVAVTGRFDRSMVPTALVGFAVNVVFASLLGGGQEEFGWRGFALPQLQERYDALTGSLVVGVVWATWHAPLFAFDVQGYATISPPLYATAVVAFSVIFAWFYNSSRGCLPAAVLLHGTINAAVNVPPVLVGGPDALPVPFAGVLAVAFWVVALSLVARYGRATLAAGPAVRPTWASEGGTDVQTDSVHDAREASDA